MKLFTRILALGTTLSTLALNVQAAQPTITQAQEVTAINNLKPVYAYATTDAYNLSAVFDPLSDMDGMSMGNATAVANTSSYWYGDSSNNLYAMATAGGIWRTFVASGVATSWSASGTVVLNGSIENGATQGSPTVVLTITLTKTGTPANLTQAQLWSALQSSTVAGITATTALTAISLGTVGTATNGWGIKAYVSTGAAQTLDPLSLSIQWAGTTAAGTALNFTTALANLHTWNPSTGIITNGSFVLTKDGRSMTISGMNASGFAKTAGIASGIMNALSAGLGGGTIKRINVAKVGFYSDIPTNVGLLRGKLTATPGSNSANEQANIVADTAFKKSTFVVGGFTTTADSSNYGLAALTASNITSVTWDVVSGPIMRATGAVGSAAAKLFTCNLSGIKVVKVGTNEVLRFTSADGDSFWVKTYDSTGLDTSSDTSVLAADQDDLLAYQLLNKLNGVTTINKLTLDAIVSAC